MPKGRKKPKPPYRVQIVVEGGLEYFREVVLGVRHYGFETGRLTFADRWLGHELEGPGEAARRDGVAGLVVAAHTVGEEAKWRETGLPVVNVSNSPRAPVLPVVTQDDVAVGRLAAEHLRGCGCRTFGFWGQPGASYSDQRWQGFTERLGGPCARGGGRTVDLAADYGRMKAWLAGLASPCGVFAGLDEQALALLRVARELGRKVPEEVAVLGAGDDDFFVEFERVPLSSIRLPARRIGYEAGRLLDGLITRGKREADSVYLPVTEVVGRKSTEVRFTREAVVGRALRVIRENPGWRVGEVVKAVGVSRTGLQGKFLRELGHGLLAEIHRVRLERARTLLATTEGLLADIAERAGLGEQQRLSRLFRRRYGQTPGSYRRQVKGGVEIRFAEGGGG